MEIARIRCISLTPRMPSSDHAGGIDGDQLSPELALVDPDLAARARQRLTADWQAQRQRERVAPPAPAPTRRALRPERPDAPVVRPRRSRQRRRRGAAFAMAAAALVAGGAAYLIASSSRIDKWLSRDEPVRSSGRSVDETHGRATANTTATTTTAAASAGTTTRFAGKSSSPKPPAASPPRQRPKQGQRQGRAFGWPPVAHANSYLVDFYKGRTKIYAARRSKPTLTLPPQWTFRRHRYRLSPGRYRWRVRAILAGRREKVVVRATLQVRRAR